MQGSRPKRPPARRSEAAEAEQYRVAAEAALDQLDYAINYLNAIRKPRIAAALRRNHGVIRRQLQ
jgi:hypothetical protein